MSDGMRTHDWVTLAALAAATYFAVPDPSAMGPGHTRFLRPAAAEQHQGSSGGGVIVDTGSGGHADTDHGDDHGGGGHGGKGGKEGKGGGAGKGQGGAQEGRFNVETMIFHADPGGHDDGGHEDGEHEDGKKGPMYMGGASQGGGHVDDSGDHAESDRPAWAGIPGRDGKPGRGDPAFGGDKGSLYGDLYVVLRDENGVPILDSLDRDADGDTSDDSHYVQPVLADGTVIQLTDSGDVPEAYANAVAEVEFGRLNVGRAPPHVLERRYIDVVAAINAASAIERDAAGRLVLVLADGTTRTVDSPLENLALYVSLLDDGALEGVAKVADKLNELAFLVDGKLTMDDLDMARSFLAAAADKTTPITIDQVVYFNRILGLEGPRPIVATDGSTYYDFTAFAYDRVEVYGGMTATVLVQDPGDGTWKEQEVDIFADVFGGVRVDGGSATGFAQSADDARRVIEFLHDQAAPVAGGEDTPTD